MSGVAVDAVSRTLHAWFEQSGKEIVYDDPSDGQRLVLNTTTASSPRGYLPAIVVAGEGIWHEATGKGFALEVVPDRDGGPATLLGYRLRGIGAGTFATVMLASIEALEQVSEPKVIRVSELETLWLAAVERLHLRAVRSLRVKPRA